MRLCGNETAVTNAFALRKGHDFGRYIYDERRVTGHDEDASMTNMYVMAVYTIPFSCLSLS